MAITYPLPITFIDSLKLNDAAFTLEFGQDVTGLASGLILGKDLRPALWKFEGQTIPHRNNLVPALEAKFRSMKGVIKTFLVYNPMAPYPYADPTGSIIGSNNVQVSSVTVASSTVAFKGLTAGYVLTAGDYFSVSYSSGKIGFHQLLESVTANGSGVTAAVEVTPPLRTGIAADDAVTLKKPYAEMRLEPNSVQPSAVGVMHTRFSFKAVQKVG